MQSLSSSFSAAKRNPGARKGRRHTVVRISRSADTNTFARCSCVAEELKGGRTCFAAHPCSNQLPEHAAKAWRTVRLSTARQYTPHVCQLVKYLYLTSTMAILFRFPTSPTIRSERSRSECILALYRQVTVNSHPDFFYAYGPGNSGRW